MYIYVSALRQLIFLRFPVDLTLFLRLLLSVALCCVQGRLLFSPLSLSFFLSWVVLSAWSPPHKSLKTQDCTNRCPPTYDALLSFSPKSKGYSSQPQLYSNQPNVGSNRKHCQSAPCYIIFLSYEKELNDQL